jgi:hypothetical protein
VSWFKFIISLRLSSAVFPTERDKYTECDKVCQEKSTERDKIFLIIFIARGISSA